MDTVNVVDIIEDMISILKIKHFKVLDTMSKNISVMDPEWDALYQLKKDLERYIQEQEHTLSLVQNGIL